MFALLLAAAVIYFALGDLKEAALLGLFATASVSIAIVQEIRSERVLRPLRDLASPRALVIRDGVAQRVAGTEIVRGDLVVLAEGDRVPADAVVVSGHDIYCDESVLTGEAAPVQRRAAAGVPQQGRPGGEIASLSEEALAARLEEVNLFCRVTPVHKSRIILALKRRGHVVGYLGDGINEGRGRHHPAATRSRGPGTRRRRGAPGFQQHHEIHHDGNQLEFREHVLDGWSRADPAVSANASGSNST